VSLDWLGLSIPPRGVEDLRSQYEASMFQMGLLLDPEVAKMVDQFLKNWHIGHMLTTNNPTVIRGIIQL